LDEDTTSANNITLSSGVAGSKLKLCGVNSIALQIFVMCRNLRGFRDGQKKTQRSILNLTLTRTVAAQQPAALVAVLGQLQKVLMATVGCFITRVRKIYIIALVQVTLGIITRDAPT
jgi:hypothetical protein